MASLIENIAKIRGTAVVGTEVREAIAEAMEQIDVPVQTAVSDAKAFLENQIENAGKAIEDKIDEYNAALNKKIDDSDDDIHNQVEAIRVIVEGRELYINLSQISEATDDYLMTIVNAT